ncbi:MAG: hypothetical protein H6502_04820 [Candidatus Woesearchaeota archaeon]|nr:MAG: hypothetical protein H6502_04820 [Candidatus Woesearchaeota archaeon]
MSDAAFSEMLKKLASVTPGLVRVVTTMPSLEIALAADGSQQSRRLHDSLRSTHKSTINGYLAQYRLIQDAFNNYLETVESQESKSEIEAYTPFFEDTITFLETALSLYEKD